MNVQVAVTHVIHKLHVSTLLATLHVSVTQVGVVMGWFVPVSEGFVLCVYFSGKTNVHTHTEQWRSAGACVTF